MTASMKNYYLQIRDTAVRLLTGLERFASVHETALFWGLGILYKFVLDALYVWVASPTYDYAGLVYTPDFLKYVLASVMFFVLYAYIPKAEHSSMSFLMHLQFAFTVAPMLTFYAFSNGSSRYMLAVFLCILLETWILRRPIQQGRSVRICGIKNYVTVALGILVLFSLAIPVLYNGFAGLKAFDFEYIYEMRANATYPPAFGYILGWMTNVIIPMAYLSCLTQKKYRWALIPFAIEILFYMETGQKFVLLILFPITIVYILALTGHLLKLMYAGFIALFLLMLVAFRLDRVEWHGIGTQMSALVAVRAIFHPADNKFKFFACFNQLPKMFFSDGQIGRMLGLTYPYKGSIGQVVFAFMGGEFMSANMNTGYLGESYAQLGFLGMFLMSALFGCILRGVQACCSRKNFGMIVSLFSIFIIILNDGALFTVLFTSGMLLAYLLVFIYFSGTAEEKVNGVQRL